MEGRHVDKYSFSARFDDYGVKWTLGLRTDDGQSHELVLSNLADVPVLLQVLQRDESIFFSPGSRTLSTGWNDPGV